MMCLVCPESNKIFGMLLACQLAVDVPCELRPRDWRVAERRLSLSLHLRSCMYGSTADDDVP
jgi:hypothetical protein